MENKQLDQLVEECSLKETYFKEQFHSIKNALQNLGESKERCPFLPPAGFRLLTCLSSTFSLS